MLFKGPWSNARVAATDFVHSRVDAIVAAGGEGYIFAVPEQPNWQRGLGRIHTDRPQRSAISGFRHANCWSLCNTKGSRVCCERAAALANREISRRVSGRFDHRLSALHNRALGGTPYRRNRELLPSRARVAVDRNGGVAVLFSSGWELESAEADVKFRSAH